MAPLCCEGVTVGEAAPCASPLGAPAEPPMLSANAIVLVLAARTKAARVIPNFRFISRSILGIADAQQRNIRLHRSDNAHPLVRFARPEKSNRPGNLAA
jgi:hypothetical protein